MVAAFFSRPPPNPLLNQEGSLSGVYSITFPLLACKYMCFQQHSRFASTHGKLILCFHRHPRIVRSLFEFTRLFHPLASRTECGGGLPNSPRKERKIRACYGFHSPRASQATISSIDFSASFGVLGAPSNLHFSLIGFILFCPKKQISRSGL